MMVAVAARFTWHATLMDATILLNCDDGKRRMNHCYVWMEEIGFEIELEWEFQIQARKIMASNLNSIVWVCLKFVVGIKGYPFEGFRSIENKIFPTEANKKAKI
jgi:hypothetical protein